MKKIYKNLLFRVFCGIVLGILVGKIAPEWFYRILLTFKGIFGNFLGFAIPLIIMGLVMPSISALGKSAGKMLLVTVAIAYSFTLFSGFSTYFVSDALFPSLLEGQKMDDIGEGILALPYFTVPMPPVMDVMTALLLSFVIGIGLSIREHSVFVEVIKEFGEVVSWLIAKAIIPVLPYYIIS